MRIGILVAAVMIAGIASASTSTLDGPALRQAIAGSETGAAPPAAGQKFRVVIPFADGRKIDMRTSQNPGRWTYDSGKKILRLSVGLGEISRANYSAFDSQGLAALPPLQTLVFSTDERRKSVTLQIMGNPPSPQVGYDHGQRSTVASFGLVAVNSSDDPGLPKGFKPLMVQEIRLSPNDLRPTINGMNLIVEGETIQLSPNSTVLCGDYSGQVGTSEINNPQTLMVDAHQCFVTVRITRALVADGHRSILASWPR